MVKFVVVITKQLKKMKKMIRSAKYYLLGSQKTRVRMIDRAFYSHFGYDILNSHLGHISRALLCYFLPTLVILLSVSLC